MKFTAIVSTFFIGSSLLFASAQACEPECQRNISQAFADAYGKEIKPIFDRFNANIRETILANVNFDKVGHAFELKQDVSSAVKSTVDNFKTDFIDSLGQLAFSSIFVQEPAYKGDCNHPKLVKQPPKGVPWKRSDCDKQTYLCGNPPAICHDIQKIKHRIFTNTNTEVSKKARNNGTYANDLYDKVAQVARSVGVSMNNRKMYLMPIVNTNIQDALRVFGTDFRESFCHTTCAEYDDSIIDELLSFP
jgi:hypothetical protein